MASLAQYSVSTAQLFRASQQQVVLYCGVSGLSPYASFFVHPPTDRHFGCFEGLAPTDKTICNAFLTLEEGAFLDPEDPSQCLATHRGGRRSWHWIPCETLWSMEPLPPVPAAHSSEVAQEQPHGQVSTVSQFRHGLLIKGD